MYSFWWDVTNDWGLLLLLPSRWSHPPPSSSLRSPHPQHFRSNTLPGRLLFSFSSSHRKALSASHQLSPTPSRPLSPTGSPDYSPSFGLTPSRFLRPQLLLPDPLIYYLAVVIDLLLRFTWSLKLSSHLHVIHELEQGTFLLEALEVLRRWMWVFIRVEWEGIRKGAAPNSDARRPGLGLGLGLAGGPTVTVQQTRAAEEGCATELSDQRARDEKAQLSPVR
jgi:hypothetical protein